MAVIQDLVLTFCPTMHSVQQKKLKFLMPVLQTLARRKISSVLQRDSNSEAIVSNPIEALKKKLRLKFAIA